MDIEQARRLLEESKEEMSARRKRNEEIIAEFGDLADLGPNLLGPTTELAKRRMIKEIQDLDNEQE
jgi:hypothetical protein